MRKKYQPSHIGLIKWYGAFSLSGFAPDPFHSGGHSTVVFQTCRCYVSARYITQRKDHHDQPHHSASASTPIPFDFGCHYGTDFLVLFHGHEQQ